MQNKLNKYVAVGIVGLVATVMSSEITFADNNLRGYVTGDVNVGAEINKNGNVVLRGATVTSISPNTIFVTSVLGPATLSWTGNIDANTKFEGKNGKTINLSDIVVGDKVTIKGIFNSGNSLSLRVTLVRDISRSLTQVPVNTKQTFEGTLSALPGQTLPTSISMMIGNTSQIVSLSAITILLNNAWNNVPLNTFQIGDKVRVFGFIPSGTNIVTGLVLRNTSR